MTPLEMGMLIHVQCFNEPLSKSPAHSDALARFLNNEIITPSEDRGTGYELTDKGKSWLDNALNTQAPSVCVWMNEKQHSEWLRMTRNRPAPTLY